MGCLSHCISLFWGTCWFILEVVKTSSDCYNLCTFSGVLYIQWWWELGIIQTGTTSNRNISHCLRGLEGLQNWGNMSEKAAKISPVWALKLLVFAEFPHRNCLVSALPVLPQWNFAVWALANIACLVTPKTRAIWSSGVLVNLLIHSKEQILAILFGVSPTSAKLVFYIERGKSIQRYIVAWLLYFTG